MTPQDRQRLAQNEQRLRSLSPAQQQELRDRARVWQQMTPEQREHIRNEVLPRWKQLSPQRQRAIQQRLGVLQNMPESARNRHLSDPSFTRGMSEEDRQLLRDLSHQHVGGASEQSQEQ
jgi:phytoene dehydrogenase-like protein